VSEVIHILDDDTSFRTSTGRLLRACGYVVETYETAEQLLTGLADDPGVSCILLDIKMPGLGGPELQNRLNAVGSARPIIFLTGDADTPTTVEAIERALARVRRMQANLEQLGPLRTLISRLSPRERQVFERVVRGKTNKEIAQDLGTTERTIKAHRHRVMEKVQVTRWPSSS
jgi:RNA polymerase sigma factor (sigma-70 family)